MAEGIGDLHETASSLFLVMLANGKIPETVCGGAYDGLSYFPIELSGFRYWVMEGGLVTPLERNC